jgi:solute carrier family 35 protein E1
MFQVGGHMFSSMAISRIPVSTVHTIKALSPLFTVAAYALLFGVSYSAKTYLSLLPLTIGVMLACTFDMSASNTSGLLCAFGSALVFVSSNIFFKKIMPSPSKSNNHSQSSHKLDKLNLLFYSSSMAFLLMIPIWLYYDLPAFLTSSTLVAHPSHGHSTPHSVTYYFFMNGTVHFAQNIIAFIILSSTSPVTYSIASLIKRVAVICIAIVWFSQSVHPVQGLGIGMTFVGLWMYNNAKGDVERGENKMRRVEAARDLMLPSTKAEEKMMSGVDTPPLVDAPMTATTGMATAHGRPRNRSMASQWPPTHHTQHQPHVTPVPQPPPHNHNHPNVHVKPSPPQVHPLPPPPPLPPTMISIPKRNVVSLLDSYPSPPASLDDTPPSSPVPFPYTHAMPLLESRVPQTRVSA